MAKINELSPHVADLIAAGEVVERPGSVVKELVENAIDAGATSLTVEIKAGGMTYIRVTDNGCGMDSEDAERAFLRHATSKLRGERDLECIGTLGFRGEALAAISAVSRIDLMTREAGAGEGSSLTIEGGQVMEAFPAGCPEGTTIIVRDLFFNTPARLKFMKSDKAEGANVSQIMLRCALSHPEISMRYIKDEKEEFHTPGDGSVRSCVYTLLGRDFAKSLIEIEGGDSDIKVSGFVTTPALGRGNRAYQFFFINGRYVKSKLIQAALEQAYKNSLFTGKFPACVLYIELKLGAVDVNVHPTKTEVKFLQEKKVFDGVYYSVLSALDNSKGMPELHITGKLKADLQRQSVIDDNVDKVNSAKSGYSVTSNKSAELSELKKQETYTMPPEFLQVKDSGPIIQTTLEQSDYVTSKHTVKLPEIDAIKESENTTSIAESQLEVSEQEEKISPIEESKEPGRIVGEAMGTYIIVEQGNRLVLIDKHAAHERILFDKMKEEEYDPMPQMLISPFVSDLGPEDTELLLENIDFMEKCGFELDRFGQGSVAMRQVPGSIAGVDLDGLLSEICLKLRMGHKLDPASARDEVLHTVACKAAIKAGKMSDTSELEDLVEMVLSGQVKYCPHGRPVSIEIKKSTLDKSFKRI